MNPQFAEQGYVGVEDFLEPGVVELAYHYVKMRIKLGFGKLPPKPDQIGARAEYGDHLMEALLDQSTPKVEQIVGKTLWPTYSFYRLYTQGMDLKRHRDRPSCEYSASICLGRSVDEDWPLFADETPYPCQPGSALIYKGCDVEHWREPLPKGEQLQVFLHYVDKEGVWGDVCRFDTRPGLGFPNESKKLRAADLAKLDELRQKHLT